MRLFGHSFYGEDVNVTWSHEDLDNFGVHHLVFAVLSPVLEGQLEVPVIDLVHALADSRGLHELQESLPVAFCHLVFGKASDSFVKRELGVFLTEAEL